MYTTERMEDIRDHLAYLQADIFNAIAIFVGVLGYFWFVWVAWPGSGRKMPAVAWIGGIALLLSAALGYLLKTRYPRYLNAASGLLVGGAVLAATCAILLFKSSDLRYLYLIPLIFASVLLSQRTVVLIAVAASLFMLALQVIDPLADDVIVPVLIFALVTVASLLSRRNLYTALAWTLNGYEEARHNAQVAQERQAELKRVLKDLDAATYNLERTNYMLRVARDRAEEARRLKQQFAQNISHELRTPLNLIVGFAETMIESPEYYGGQLPSAYLRDLSIIYRNARHLQGLVNDVLDLARIEAAQMNLVPEKTNLAVLVEEAVDTARSLVEMQGLELFTEIEPGLPPLWVDPVRIRQVLFNLLNNAARFTEQGYVSVHVYQKDNQVIVAVKDTGVGIAPEDVPRVFEAFHQLDGSMQRRRSGVGLGLTISKRFVELHGGRIWAESEPGRGSTFYFSLPVNNTATLSYLVESDPALSPQARQPRLVLAITRSTSAATMLTRYLRDCRTIIVQDLEQARSVARQMLPQVILVDPSDAAWGGDGIEALSEAWGLPHTPFIACVLPGVERQGRRGTASGYLIKPVSRESLWDVLRQFAEDVDRVLVVDDDQDFVQLMTRLLDNPLRRYQVFSAYSGKEALAMITRLKPDLVLLDLKLPDLDGLAVMERIRSIPAGKDIPIVIVSGQDEVNALESLGGPITINKLSGFQPGEVLRVIQAVLDATTPPTAPDQPGEALLLHVNPG